MPDVNSALGFNRYAYVYNNPLKYVDPDGHFPWLFFLGAISYTIGATSDNAWVHSIGMLLGSKLMSMGLAGAFGDGYAILEGAVRTFAQSVLSGQDIEQIFTNTALFAINAQITGDLPGVLNHNDHGFGFGLMIGHGLVQGAFTALRGGKFKTGFISGMASKAISGIMDSMGYMKDPTFGKMTINAILSGLASKAAGGDFVQGAMSAMVVWLYNEWGNVFRTASAAAREATSAAFYLMRTDGNNDDKEWHGVIYRKGKGYSYSKPTREGATKINTSIPEVDTYEGYVIVGYYHIHTITELNGKTYDPENFSQADIDVLTKDGRQWRFVFVGTLKGRVLRYMYNPKTVNNWKNHQDYMGRWTGVYQQSVARSMAADAQKGML